MESNSLEQNPRSKADLTEQTQEYVGGSTVRRYLNENVTQHLLEGLKKLSNEKPEDPLKWLGEYLIAASNSKADDK